MKNTAYIYNEMVSNQIQKHFRPRLIEVYSWNARLFQHWLILSIEKRELPESKTNREWATNLELGKMLEWAFFPRR